MKKLGMFVALAVVVSVPAVAQAENDSLKDESYRLAPAKAFELTLANGYNQGFGRADRDTSLGDMAHGGLSLQLGLGARIDPRWSVGVYGEGARYSANSQLPDGTHGYSAATGVQGTFHLMPFSRVNPWVSLGTGVRGYWLDQPDARTRSLYGFDIARVRVGADYKLSPSLSLGPVVGASLSTLVTERDSSNRDHVKSLEGAGMSTFFFAGIQSRFDIGGDRVSAGGRTVASR